MLDRCCTPYLCSNDGSVHQQRRDFDIDRASGIVNYISTQYSRRHDRDHFEHDQREPRHWD